MNTRNEIADRLRSMARTADMAILNFIVGNYDEAEECNSAEVNKALKILSKEYPVLHKRQLKIVSTMLSQEQNKKNREELRSILAKLSNDRYIDFIDRYRLFLVACRGTILGSVKEGWKGEKSAEAIVELYQNARVQYKIVEAERMTILVNEFAKALQNEKLKEILRSIMGVWG